MTGQQAWLNYLGSLLCISWAEAGLKLKPNKHSKLHCKELVTVHRGGWDLSWLLHSATVTSTRGLTSVTQRLKCKSLGDQFSWIRADSHHTKPRQFGAWSNDPYLLYRREFLTNNLWELRTDSQRKQERAINKWLRIMTPPSLAIFSL